MRCPNCGEKVEEDVLFCPHCGQNISVRSKRKLRFILMDVQDDRRFRHLASAAVLTVVIVAVLAVLLALDIGNDDGGDTGGPSSSAIILSDTEYIEVYGCLKDGDMTASMNSNGYLVIRLSDDIRDSYGSFSWVLRNEFLNENQTVTNDTGTLTWPNPVIGVHTVTVTCSDPLTGETAVYTGTLEYCGNVHTQHTFVFDGSSYTVYVDVTNQEYRIYSSANIAYTEDRNTGSAASGAGFITTDGAVAVLVERLIAAYTNSDPSLSVSDERFADFILSFVQSCFRTGSDAYYNSRPTYWAYPAETLYETIPHFHDTEARLARLKEVVAADPLGRVKEVGPELDFVAAREADCSVVLEALRQGELPLRVTHNDTKLNNVLMDRKTGEAVCVIDLDTVMPGLAVNDFGDSIRFGANHCAEDERDLNKVCFDLNLFDAYTQGFLEGADGALTPAELDYLPWGARLITLECGIRFLTDYLEGDKYFRIHRPGQNLDRCRTQFKLVADMEACWDKMCLAVDKYR